MGPIGPDNVCSDSPAKDSAPAFVYNKVPMNIQENRQQVEVAFLLLPFPEARA